MLGKASIAVLEKAIFALQNDLSSEKSKIVLVSRKIINHPIKVIASFFAAPFLITRVAFVVKNPIRKAIAIIGLIISFILSYMAGTFLGSLAGFVFIASHIGLLAGLGFIIGTTLSIFLSVVFSIIVFNSVSFLFFKMSSQEVVSYLVNISK